MLLFTIVLLTAKVYYFIEKLEVWRKTWNYKEGEDIHSFWEREQSWFIDSSLIQHSIFRFFSFFS